MPLSHLTGFEQARLDRVHIRRDARNAVEGVTIALKPSEVRELLNALRNRGRLQSWIAIESARRALNQEGVAV